MVDDDRSSVAPSASVPRSASDVPSAASSSVNPVNALGTPPVTVNATGISGSAAAGSSSSRTTVTLSHSAAARELRSPTDPLA